MTLPFPIGDASSMRYGSFPWATVGLIIVNLAIFLFWQYPDILRFYDAPTYAEQEVAWNAVYDRVYTFGSWSMLIREQTGIGAVSTFTGMSMHGSFHHVAGNMIYLWVFGQRVEDACGMWRFLLFYLFAGMISSMAYYIIIAKDTLPSIGASGAIAGVMGAYFILFPGTRIRCVWIGMTFLSAVWNGILRIVGSKRGAFRWTLTIPSFLLIIPFIGSDTVAMFESVVSRELIGRINYVGHAGGFFSAITIVLFVRKDLVNRFFAGRRL